MNRFGAIVTGAILLAALFAWWIKGDLEMGWLVAWPAIVAVTVLLVGLGSFALPSGFPRFAACLAALPFGMLLAWGAASTTNHWPRPPSSERLDDARTIATDTARLQRLAREVLDLPVEVGGATVDSTDGLLSKESGRLTLRRRPPEVRIRISFAVGPYPPLRLVVAPDGTLTPTEPLPATGELTIQREAIERRYPDAPLVEVGGHGPFAPGELVPLRLVRSEVDWQLAIVRVGAAEDAIREVSRITKEELEAGMQRALRATGSRATRFRTHFQPGGYRVMFFPRPAFIFQGRLDNGNLTSLRAALDGDSIVYLLGDGY